MLTKSGVSTRSALRKLFPGRRLELPQPGEIRATEDPFVGNRKFSAE